MVVAQAVNKEKGSIEIQTAEGDRVSIRFRSRDLVALASAQSTGAAGTDPASRMTVLSRGRVQVEVAGNLNADELAAVGNLLDQIDALATKFFGGDAQAAFDAAANIGFDSKQIAGFSVDLTYSRTLAAAVASTGSPVPTAPAANDGAPAAEAPSAPPASPNATDAAPAADVPSAPPASPDATDAAPAGSAPPPAAQPANIVDAITGFLHDVLARLASTTGTSQLNFSMSWKLSLLIQALPAYATQTDSGNSTDKPAGASAGTQLLGDTLQRLAA